MTETPIVQSIRAALGMRTTGRTFRNNTGALQDRHGRWVYFGLAEGSSDLVGIEAVTITPEMVGRTIGVFVSIEVKREGRDTTHKERKKLQEAWRSMVIRFGGRAGVARSEDEALAIVEGRAQ